MIEAGIPDLHNDILPSLQEYYSFQEHLSTVDSVTIYTFLMKGHSYITALSYFHDFEDWESQLMSMRNTCNPCNRMATSLL